jgi:hypothetical protein
VRCDGTVVALAGLGGGALAPVLGRHVAGCLRCQAEQARRRRLLRLLAQLRAEQAALKPGVLAAIFDAIGTAATEDVPVAPAKRQRPWRAPLAAAGAAAVAAVGLGAFARVVRQSPPAGRWYR